VVDCGRNTSGMLQAEPHIPGLTASVRSLAEELLVLEVAESCPLARGDQVQVISGYAPLTVNLHEV
jgi:hypothetical protein